MCIRDRVQTVDIALQVSKKIEILHKKLQKMEMNFEEHKSFDKVKAYIMDKFGLSEKEAHRKLQEYSMHTGKRIAEIVKDVLEDKINFI